MFCLEGPNTVSFAMGTSSLEVTRAQLALISLYLNKAEARDKICRAIQYGSKFVSGGEPGTAQQVDKSTSLARKVFRLMKSVNEIQTLLSPPPKNSPLPLILLSRAKSALIATFLALDQVVWLGRVGIYKNKERTDLLSRISLFCWLAGSGCQSLTEASEIARLIAAKKKAERDFRRQALQNGTAADASLKDVYINTAMKSQERALGLIKSSLDIVVAIGLLQLAPKTVNPRLTGALGVITSLISCYQLLPPQPSKTKTA
eukprot:TRINITY_DN6989_c0_g1_i2.p1 TRINITY_DN6989_c0_g1~~TRINITY_DN6989_c0_g1_i2.p1  ORF type:complete len:260 (+),score=27.10 TRINITY_DN6989_c0_g1_i2:82-861(+)